MWSGTVGLVNGQYKYLTAETFGHKVNSNGVSLKKKQLWSIEPFPIKASTNGNSINGRGSFSPTSSIDELDELENVSIRSHLNCYLAVDSYGNVTCNSSELTDNCRFTITICSMTQEGQDEDQISWAFRNISRGYFLGVSGDDGAIVCNAKMPQSKAELWHVHLVPASGATMFALKSIGRKRYGRIIATEPDKLEQVQVDSTNPWGPQTLFQFKYFDNGNYALVAASSISSKIKYVTSDGACIDAGSAQKEMPPKNCLFTIEYHGGCIAFRDKCGRYLAAAGRQAVLRTRSNAVGKDELFEFEPAPLQVAFRATFNNKWVSIKQGIDLSANQNDVTQHETFQMEYDQSDNYWYLSTSDNKYWSFGVASTVQVASGDLNSRARFRIVWNVDDGTCSLFATDSTGQLRTLGARKSGQLFTSGPESIRFYIKFLNRTRISLRGANSSGFVGTKGQGSVKLESNKTIPDLFTIEYANSDNLSTDDPDELNSTFNCCYFKLLSTGKYLNVVDGQTICADASSMACAQQFQLELRTGTYLAIRTVDSGNYLNLTANGSLVLSPCLPEKATLWEF